MKYKIYNVSDIIKLEKRERLKMKWSDRLADKITGVSGSMSFVFIHIVWFSVWIFINSGVASNVVPFDPYPYSFLTMTVSLEAIFLSAFVLISQNKQALIADRRAKVDLQVNTINERESTKILQILLDMSKFIGMKNTFDAEIKELEKKTNITRLARNIDRAEEKLIDSRR